MAATVAILKVFFKILSPEPEGQSTQNFIGSIKVYLFKLQPWGKKKGPHSPGVTSLVFRWAIQDIVISAILNFHVTPMPPIKFWLNLTYGLGDAVWRISKWPLWQASWISEWNYFSNSHLHNTPLPPIKFKLLAIQEQMWFEDFQDGGHLGYKDETILAILNLHVALMSSTKFWLNLTYRSRADNNERFLRWP